MSEPVNPPPASLKRELGVGSAVLLGLGSMVGTGVYVSLGLGAGLVGPYVLGAIVVAGLLAMCNGLSSAQLAAAHPVAGGTYEYGHRVGWPMLGTVAGGMFLVAKSASAATAALGLAGYVLHRFDAPNLVIPGALAVVIMVGVMVLEGIRRTSLVNTVIVAITLLGLSVFVLSGLGSIQAEHLWPSEQDQARGFGAFAYATALMFVAYTGYGRIATLGEEVHTPHRTIPLAIFVTVLVCMVFYTAVGTVALGIVGAERFEAVTKVGGAALESIATDAELPPAVVWVVTVSAVTAMLGVILNLILGLSRVALAMGRRRHLPGVFAKVSEAKSTPAPAVLLVCAIVLGLICLGSIKAAWSLSAVTVLVYYAITNAAALRLPPSKRLYPRLFSWLGLFGCLGLSVFVEPIYWAWGGGMIAVMLVWYAATRGRTVEPATGG